LHARLAAGAGRRPRRSSVRHRLGLPCGRSEYDPDRRHCAQRQRLGPITQRDSHTSEPRIRGVGYALRADGEFVAAGRRGTAGSGASPSLVFSAQVALPAALRPARRAVPAAGTDLVAGRVVLLEAEPAGWQQGPSQRASPAGGTGPGSPRPQRQPDGADGSSEAARHASPLGWWSRSRYGPVATAASPCHSRPRA
jgi:hypothetical protein